MKRIIISNLLIVISLLFINLNCTSSPKIKPKPASGDYTVCPLCKGTGIAEVTEAVPAAGNMRDRNVKLEKEIVSATELGCCLFNILDAWQSNGERSVSSEMENIDDVFDKTGGKNKYEQDYDENIRRSTITRKIGCYRCKGSGWLQSADDSGNNNLPDYERNEAYKRLSKEMDKE